MQDKRKQYQDTKHSYLRLRDNLDIEMTDYVSSIDPNATEMTEDEIKENKIEFNSAQVE